MATVKIKLRQSAIKGHAGTIYYQVIHERKVRQIQTPYRVYEDEWDNRRAMLMIDVLSKRHEAVMEMRSNIRCDVERLKRIISKLDESGMPFTTEEIVDEYNRYMAEFTLFTYTDGVISYLKRNGRDRTSETYRAALNSFCRYRGGRDIMLDAISPSVMEEYQTWLRRRSVVPNTISFYARILRAVYNRAVEDDITPNKHPFRRVYTGIDRTEKRALPLDVIRRIKKMELTHSPHLNYARDMFLLSFYMRGMSFIDMAFLRKSDLENGHITYRRRKTGQLLTVAWTREMQNILDKYPVEGPYLLPIIKHPSVNERSAYKNAQYNINRSLKQIGVRLGLKSRFTMYVARHSWASVAKSTGIPLSVISEGMGHDSESTTRIYLASLDTSDVDRANSIILKSL